MQFDCGCLDPDPIRFRNQRYIRAVDGWRDDELMVFLATPGLLPEHFQAFFGWSPARRRRVRALDLSGYRDRGRANAATITIEDGLRMMELVLEFGSNRIVPYWSYLAICELPVQDVAERLRMSRARVFHLRKIPYWGLGGVFLGLWTRGWPVWGVAAAEDGEDGEEQNG